EGDPGEPPRLRLDPRVGRIDTVHIGVDVASIRLQCGRKRYRGRVGPTAAERRNAPVGPDPLEAGDHCNLALLEPAHDLGAVNVHDARGTMRVVGADRYLPALPGARVDTACLQHQRQQARTHLLAGGDHRVVFARIVNVEIRALGLRRLLHPGDQLVGL